MGSVGSRAFSIAGPRMDGLRALLLGMGLALAGGAYAADPATPGDEAVYRERLANTGPNGRDSYDPLEAVPGAEATRSLPVASQPRLSANTLAAARAYAFDNRSRALLIWLDGALQTVAYGGGTTATTPLNSRSMSKPLGAVAIGRAIELGAIRSLEQPAAEFIMEWRGTPKAAISLRQLLNMTSGLEEQGPVKDPASIWSRAYLHPRHDAILIDEYPLTATPGSRYQYSNASAELIAVVIERATRRRYASFVSQEILRPLGAAGGEVWVDRPGGLAHSGCCMLLPAETWLRLGILLLNDGVWAGRTLLPPGYVKEMRTPSASNPRYGLGVWIEGEYLRYRGFGRPEQGFDEVLHGEAYLARDLFLFDGNADQVLYIVPSRRLVIFRMGDAPPKSPEWDNAVLPNLVLRDIAKSD